MAEIGAFGGAGLGVGLAEGLRFGPGVKDGGRVPDRVGGVERVVVVGGAAQEVKFAEAGAGWSRRLDAARFRQFGRDRCGPG